MLRPTDEQLAVIHHTGGHARVLAVAGSGKTTTMGLRVYHLAKSQQVEARTIRVLTFNRLASQQFKAKLDLLGMRRKECPYVSTFHAFAYQFVQMALKDGFLPKGEFWIGKEEEKARMLVLRTMQELAKKQKIPEGAIDVEEAMEAISLWKGALIPPERAGHHTNKFLPLVYAQFEKKRKVSNAYTFDDFVPAVVDLLSTNNRLQKRWCGRLQQLIVDEYQDVNAGQQRLIELLAGKTADVMVVGDDDQTIYEWRGARPEFILEEFVSAFPDKQHTTYTLSRSFRFGPSLASCAYNTIRNNSKRTQKKLVAHDRRWKSEVILVESTVQNRESIHHALANELKSLIQKKKVHPSEIWVLGRMYAQLSIFESQCLATGIPYKVLGNVPFFKRAEVQKIIEYLRVVLQLDDPISPSVKQAFMSIANTPNRYLKRTMLKETLQVASREGYSIRGYLHVLLEHLEPEKTKHRSVKNLLWVLDRAHTMLPGRQNGKKRAGKKQCSDAGSIMKWITLHVDYPAHFKDYYGEGEDAFERMETLRNFTDFAQSLNLGPQEFLQHMHSLDSRQGAPEEALITMTTVHKTKGLEFDYVFIPSCQEGYMPCLLNNEQPIFDTQGLVSPAEPSSMIENERRLFYVALTRARKAVYIGTKHPDEDQPESTSVPSRFISEMKCTD